MRGHAVKHHALRTLILESGLAILFFVLYQAAESLSVLKSYGIILSLAALMLIAGTLIGLDRHLAEPTLKKLTKTDIRRILLALISLMGLSVCISLFMGLAGIQADQPENQQIIIQVMNHNLGFAVWAFISGSFLAPVIEEFIFRRFLIGHFNQPKRLWTLRIIFSVFIFTFLHSYTDLAQITGQLSFTGVANLASSLMLYLGLSLAFTWLYARTKNLSASLAAHALNNIISLTLILLTL